jgi:low affinity Fe/Cu permease
VLNWRWSAAAGAALGLIYAGSPLFIVAVAAAAVVLLAAGRALPASERRRLQTILALAIAVRFVFIGVMLIRGIPFLNDLSIGALSGDDAYYMSRALRARDIALGLTQGKYDFFIVSDEYGRTSYLQGMTLLQLLFGPSPYGTQAINAGRFVGAAYLLFRLARQAYGATTAVVGLTTVLFLPSLFVGSASLLKESTHFFVTSLLLALVIAALRHPRLAVRVAAVAMAAACLLILDDLRRGALVLSIAGIATAIAIRVAFETPRRAIAAAVLAATIVVVAWSQPSIHARAIDAVTSAAKTHGGHVFTIGHAYKLLDEGFYVYPGTPAAWHLELTDAQAARFVVRAARSFLFTPWPWEIRSRSELAFLPEHMIWLLIVVFAPIGAVAGWRRDRVITSLLIGFVLPTAAALALTNGNVGTLLRLRGLVSPYLIWIAVFGALSAAEFVLGRRPAAAPQSAGAWT